MVRESLEFQTRVLVRRPGYIPFGFIVRAVFIEQRIITAILYQFLESSLPEMMNKDIGRAHNAVPLRFHSLRVIIILEHADPELLIERPYLIVCIPPERHAK